MQISIGIESNQKKSVVIKSEQGKSVIVKAIAGTLKHTGTMESTFKKIMVSPEGALSMLDPLRPVADALYGALGELDPKKYSQEATKILYAHLREVGVRDPKQALTKYPHQLSYSEAVAIGILRMILAKPELLILDDPFMKIDELIAQKVVKKIKAQSNLAVLHFTSHIEAARLLSQEDMITII